MSNFDVKAATGMGGGESLGYLRRGLLLSPLSLLRLLVLVQLLLLLLQLSPLLLLHRLLVELLVPSGILNLLEMLVGWLYRSCAIITDSPRQGDLLKTVMPGHDHLCLGVVVSSHLMDRKLLLLLSLWLLLLLWSLGQSLQVGGRKSRFPRRRSPLAVCRWTRQVLKSM